MSEWSFQKIDNHVELALSRITSAYQEDEILRGLVTINARRAQVLEDAIYTLFTGRWLFSAEGVQLDLLGESVGEPRLGRSDEEYLDAINLRITLNRSCGEPELILEFIRRVFGATDVRYTEIYPCKVQLFIDVSLTHEEAKALRKIVPSGVGTIFVGSSEGDTPFGFYELNKGYPGNVNTFGELQGYHLELDDESTLAVNFSDTLELFDTNDYELPIEGGKFSDNFEV